MKKPRKKIGKDRNSNSRASSSRGKRNDNGITTGKNSGPIPFDLTIDILTRLPVKSLVRFQCVSKEWSSIIRRRDFVNSYLTRSSTRSRLLLTFMDADAGERFFYSWPHPQNPDEVSTCVANHDLTVPGVSCYVMSHSIRGLICCASWPRLVICNPSTKQLITLPEIKSKSRRVYIFFGHDPIDDQYKVLCMMKVEGYGCRKSVLDQEHQISTLGARRKSWRTIEGCAPHYPATDGLCINGVLYYGASTKLDSSTEGSMIVSFDVRSEKFNVIKVPEAALILSRECSTLINYEGKLAGVYYSGFTCDGSFDLWILEDAGRQEWSKKTYVLPPSWRDLVGRTEVTFHGTIHTGEIILAPQFLANPSNPLYVFYYDMKKHSFRKVEIEGIEADDELYDDISCELSFSDHVENIMLL